VTTLLVIDIGNTNVSLGLFDYPDEKSGQLAHHWRIGTHREQTSDEVALTLSALFDHAERDPAEVTDMIISSVVPPLLPIWERVSSKLFERPALVVGPGIRTGMPVRYENPREVGADRIVNAVAAVALVGAPVIAVDFGTATTFDCVSDRGEYLGGAIFPGIHVAMEALFDRASMLHRIEIARPRSVIGRPTESLHRASCSATPAWSTRWSSASAPSSAPRRASSPRADSRSSSPARRTASSASSPSSPSRACGCSSRRTAPSGRFRARRSDPMGPTNVASRRSFALVGHAGDGKTSVAEGLLHTAGATRALGRVDDGSSVLDHWPEEKERRHTFSSHVFTFEHRGHVVTLVDTPGDANFSGEGQICLAALDAAVLVVSAVDGVKVSTTVAARRAAGLPALAFVNGMDRSAPTSSGARGLSSLDGGGRWRHHPDRRRGGFEGVVDAARVAVRPTARRAGRSAAAARPATVAEAVAERRRADRVPRGRHLSDAEVARGLAACAPGRSCPCCAAPPRP
jgi:type III pantothenate kinase